MPRPNDEIAKSPSILLKVGFAFLSSTLFLLVTFWEVTPARSMEDTSSYPSRVIKIVVPYTPSGPNDVLARMIADGLSAKWNANVIVDNRPGAGTIVGTEFVARSAADGYTLLMVSLGTATNIILRKSLPYDTFKDFTPVVRLAESSNVLVANLDTPIKTVSDLISLAKKSPGQISYGIGGIGSATDLASHLLCLSTGSDMVGVPYAGDGPALIDLLGGRISWMFGTIVPVLPYVQSNKIRPVAVTGTRPVAVLPGVPPVAETIPSFDATSWYGIFAPAGTPPDIVAKLNTAINEILKSQKIKDFLEQQGTVAAGDDAADFAAFFKSQTEKWSKVIKEAGIEPQ